MPPPPVILSMIASTICGSAHDGSGTMPMSGNASATTCAAGTSLAAPSSSARMLATLAEAGHSHKSLSWLPPRARVAGPPTRVTWGPRGLRICP